MATKLPIKHYETHTRTKIHGETIPTVILTRSNQDQPRTSQFKFYVGGTNMVITHEVPHPR